MNHRDQVEAVPPGFDVLASTDTCAIAAMAHRERPLMAVQFHPEVVHTDVRDVRSCRISFSAFAAAPRIGILRIASGPIEDEIRAVAGDRNVFFFVSGGVDSTVAYTLCLRALGPERVYGIYVDTGLMREGETDYVQRLFAAAGRHGLSRRSGRERVSRARSKASAIPRQKRHIIGEQFVAVQERILSTGHFLDGHWILGQGTIYPDTIESGGTAQRRCHQDPSQPRGRDSEADRDRPDHRAAGVVLQR